jgi:hypothetical protein
VQHNLGLLVYFYANSWRKQDWMRDMLKSFCLFILLGLPIPSMAEAALQHIPGKADTRWVFIQPSRAVEGIPVRIVAHDEPWEEVVGDIQERFPRTPSGKAMKIGFYGHGAFVAPDQVVAQSMPFVAALGLSAEMDIMVFPRWLFPHKNPLWELPNTIIQELWETPPSKLRETLRGMLQRPLRQFDTENRSATARAALRLAQGIHAFHRAQMTPALAAFSNSAIVLVRLSELLERGRLTDGEQTLILPETIRQGVAIRDLVMFGYPLPNGTMAPALRQRVQGSLVNIIPAACWKQLAGNFPVSGAVENIAVTWAPAHTNWPHLPAQSESMAILGAFLGGRSQAGRLAVQLSSRPNSITRWTESWQDTVCDLLPDFRQFLQN